MVSWENYLKTCLFEQWFYAIVHKIWFLCIKMWSKLLPNTNFWNFWNKISRIFSSSHLELSYLSLSDPWGSGNHIDLAGCANIITHVLEFAHNSFVRLCKHDKCILMGFFLLFKLYSFRHHNWQSLGNYESP